MMSSLSARDSANAAQADADYMLGQTGETVVYIFPTGDALMTRDTANAAADLATSQPALMICPLPSREESALIDQRLAAGKLTVAQVEVARYDQSVTGISLTEALAMRGWI
ncbi:MAG: hypothetical protein VKI82_10280 [Leptolyngbya sp.]|nr:hypothetical protein [Leptolyngbya sp.]